MASLAMVGLSVFGAPITWQAPLRIGSSGGTGEADVETLGGKVYAYTAGAAATVNSQAFSAGLVNNLNNADIQMSISSGTGGTSTTPFGVGTAGTQYYALSANYQNIVKGGTYASGTPVPYFTVTLKRLTVNRRYLVQIWVNDSRSGTTVTRIANVAGGGGNTVTLRYNDTQAAGGVGYYAIGLFTPDASTQTFTITGDASSQLNAIQVRDLSPVVSWKGGNGDWDTSTENWQRAGLCAWTNANNDTAYFWDSPGTVSLTEGITIGGLSFNIAGYMLSGSTMTLGQDSTFDMPVTGSSTNNSTLAGTFGLTKTGQGRVVLGGTDSYTGRTLVSGGTLALHGDGTARTGTITNNATLELGHADAIKSSTLVPGNATTLSLAGSTSITYSAPATINLASGAGLSFKSDDAQAGTIQTLPTSFVSGGGSPTFWASARNNTTLKLNLFQTGTTGFNTVTFNATSGNVYIEKFNSTGSGGSAGIYLALNASNGSIITVGNGGINHSGRSFLPRFDSTDNTGVIILDGPVTRNSNNWSYYGNFSGGTLVLKDTTVAGLIFASIGTASKMATFDVQVSSDITLPNSYNNADVIDWDGNVGFGSAATLKSLNLGNTTKGYNLGASAHAERVISVLGKASNLLIAGGPIANGTTTTNLTKDGVGVFRVDKANNYTGLTRVKAGTLLLNIANAINPASAGVQVDEGATVEIQNFNQSFKMLSGEGTITRGSGIMTVTEAVYPGGTNHIGNLTLPVSSVLSDNATIYIDAVPASGSDTLVFAGNPPDLSRVNLACVGAPTTVFANKDIAYLVMRSNTGAFLPAQLPNAMVPAGWRLKIISGTNVYLEYPKGTLITFQ